VPLVPRSGSLSRFGLALLLAGCRPAARVGDEAVSEALPSAPVVVSEPSGPLALPDFAELAERMSPSVVSVVSALPPEGRKGRRPRRGVGSGMVVRADGEVLTNHHVIAGAMSFAIQYADGSRVAARLVHGDPALDLALLAPEIAMTGRVPVQLSERRPRPGEWTMAIGHPFGLGDTVTVGVISGLGRDHDDLGRPESLDPDGVWSFIQTDASINLGNSGGPLVDLRGEVVGLTTAVRSEGQGLAFAVPAPMAQKFLAEVRAHGRFRHARLGVDVSEDDERPAVRVLRVTRDGPAARGGVLPGDLILAAGDAPVARVSELAFRGRLSGVGQPLTLELQRGPMRLALKIVPDEAPLVGD
jgi:S1-C subfamily serine protease